MKHSSPHGIASDSVAALSIFERMFPHASAFAAPLRACILVPTSLNTLSSILRLSNGPESSSTAGGAVGEMTDGWWPISPPLRTLIQIESNSNSNCLAVCSRLSDFEFGG